MAANAINLPEGFVLDQKPSQPVGLPEGFVLDAKQPDSVQTMGAKYLTEHPFKFLQQGLLTTATGKGFGERAFQAMEPPVSEQVSFRQDPLKAGMQTAGQAVAGMAGDVADLYTSPMTYATMGAGPLVSGAGKTLSKIPALAQFGARTGRFIRPVTEMAKNIGNYPLENLLPKSPVNEAFKIYQRAFGPKIKNLGDVGKIKEQRIDALNTMLDSTPEFKFTDLGTGEEIIGQAPKNRWEFVQAFKQTKESIWREATKLSKGATEAGARVNIVKVVKDAQDDIVKKYGEAVKVFNPQKGKPSIEKSMENILKNARIKSEATPEESQQFLAYLNDQVKGLRNSGQAVDYTTKDFLDQIRYRLSDATDNAIENAINQTGYKDLRYKYASLKSMEKEAIKAADNFMREQAGREAGVVHPIINIVSLEDAMLGFLSGNPHQIARGGMLKAVGKLYDYMKSPDRKIPEMFALLNDAKTAKALKAVMPRQPSNKIPTIAGAGVLAGSLLAGGQAQANENIDMSKIYGIESSNNPKAFNAKSKARGLGQITPIVLKEYNQFHPKDKINEDKLFDEDTNKKISDWYMNKRIPQMLKYYKLEDTPRNRLIAYNAGISYVRYKTPLKKETKDYIKKYGIKE